MHGWRWVDTARCTHCAIYTPVADILASATGSFYCSPCGVPPGRVTRGVDAPIAHGSTDRRVRLVVGLMLLAALSFPFAACVSQL